MNVIFVNHFEIKHGEIADKFVFELNDFFVTSMIKIENFENDEQTNFSFIIFRPFVVFKLCHEAFIENSRKEIFPLKTLTSHQPSGELKCH